VATGLGGALQRSSVQPPSSAPPQPQAFRVVRTGTDGLPVDAAPPGTPGFGAELEIPSVFRRRPQTVEALRNSGVDVSDIPAFLRRQAD
jgi:cell division protein FtsZ